MAYVHPDVAGEMMASEVIQRRKEESVMAQFVNFKYGAGLAKFKGQTVNVPFPVIDPTNIGHEHTSGADFVPTWVDFDKMEIVVEKAYGLMIASDLADDSMDPYDRLNDSLPGYLAEYNKLFDAYIVGKIRAATVDLDGNAINLIDEAAISGSAGDPITVGSGVGEVTPKELVLLASKLLVPLGINQLHVGFSFLTELKNELGVQFINREQIKGGEIVRDVNGMDVVYNNNVKDSSTEVVAWAQNNNAVYGVYALKDALYIPRLEMKPANAFQALELYGATVNGDNVAHVNYEMA